MEKDIRCSNPDCKRYLGKSLGTVIAELKCPGCKMECHVKMINIHQASDIRYKFKSAEVIPTKKTIDK